MKRLLVLAFVVLGSVPTFTPAVELNNVRPCFGPFGATRNEKVCLPGDFIFMTYDIDDLAIDPKTKKVIYDTKLEVIDDANPKNPVFKNTTPSEAIPALGGSRMPGSLQYLFGPDQKAGDYTILLSVYDKVSKKSIGFEYKLKVLPKGFGFIHVLAPAVGFPGNHHVTSFLMVNLGMAPVEDDVLDKDGKKTGKKVKRVVEVDELDKDGKKTGKKVKVPVMQADAELTIRVHEGSKKDIVPIATLEIPKALPVGTDLNGNNFVQIRHPLLLNRAGRYTIEIEATDKTSGKKATLTHPLTVLDVGSIK